jgi:hypothetical protein
MQCKFNAEIAIHLPGAGGREKPLIWVFQELFVCMNCGSAEFAVPEGQLRGLAKRDAASVG